MKPPELPRLVTDFDELREGDTVRVVSPIDGRPFEGPLEPFKGRPSTWKVRLVETLSYVLNRGVVEDGRVTLLSRAGETP